MMHENISATFMCQCAFWRYVRFTSLLGKKNLKLVLADLSWPPNWIFFFWPTKKNAQNSYEIIETDQPKQLH